MDSCRACVMPVAKPDFHAILLGQLSVCCPIKNVVVVKLIPSPAYPAFLFFLHNAPHFHASFIFSNSRGVRVSIPISFASCTVPSIKAFISLLS